MKKVIQFLKAWGAFLVFMLMIPTVALAQAVDVPTPDISSLKEIFATFTGAVGAVLFITQWLKKMFKVKDGWALFFSWLVSTVLAFIGWWLKLGIFELLPNIYYVLTYGFGIWLIANRIFSIEIVKELLSKWFPVPVPK